MYPPSEERDGKQTTTLTTGRICVVVLRARSWSGSPVSVSSAAFEYPHSSLTLLVRAADRDGPLSCALTRLCASAVFVSFTDILGSGPSALS